MRLTEAQKEERRIAASLRRRLAKARAIAAQTPTRIVTIRAESKKRNSQKAYSIAVEKAKNGYMRIAFFNVDGVEFAHAHVKEEVNDK